MTIWSLFVPIQINHRSVPFWMKTFPLALIDHSFHVWNEHVIYSMSQTIDNRRNSTFMSTCHLTCLSKQNETTSTGAYPLFNAYCAHYQWRTTLTGVYCFDGQLIMRCFPFTKADLWVV